MKKLKNKINKKNFLIAGIGAVCVTNTLCLSTTQTVFANNTSVSSNVTKIAITDVHIRANAWSNSPILGVLKLGETIDVSNVINGWNQVYYNGQTGYIDYRYLITPVATPASTPVATPIDTPIIINTVTTISAPVTTTVTTTPVKNVDEVHFNEDMQAFLIGNGGPAETNEYPEYEVIDYEVLLAEISENNQNLDNDTDCLIENFLIPTISTNYEDTTPKEPEIILPVTRTVITASSIRANTLLGSAVLGMIFPGETIIVTEIIDGYEKFDYNGQIGYIDSRHVR